MALRRTSVHRYYTIESLESWQWKPNEYGTATVNISLWIKAGSLLQWALTAYQSSFQWQMQASVKMNCWFSVNFWQGLSHRWIAVFTGKTQHQQTFQATHMMSRLLSQQEMPCPRVLLPIHNLSPINSVSISNMNNPQSCAPSSHNVLT